MRYSSIKLGRLGATLALLGLAATTQAATVQVQVTVQNLVPANGIAFAPLHLGFHSGSFDAFNLGQSANTAIQSVAEGGQGGAWQAAFALADPGATRGTVGGLLLAGQTQTQSFMVDTASNPFFTFASMVVPSNDFFIGNDSPTQYRLFDSAGHLQISSITQKARQIWDAGSEVFDPAAAAFVGNNSLRSDQHGVVNFNFAELAGFNGLTTGAGYVFHSGLSYDQDVYRISFSAAAVPEPQSYALLAAGLLLMGGIVRRRQSKA
ncbi:hypothetical protein HNP55_001102 [Paucibacter oligotrophus]|uniref:Secreted protein with PEP-CTERM sorting signal n=1 Tax=Roseateles oligotrophus TaxID=1769250 RepID=A0A840LB63_9BURK|nr:spondin domain-containing protein [Roseateles oligotrophus]MBB4842587.1 hypothetical protein [Roseateles oligotrophus]